jgi:hypothetical protein
MKMVLKWVVRSGAVAISAPVASEVPGSILAVIEDATLFDSVGFPRVLRFPPTKIVQILSKEPILSNRAHGSTKYLNEMARAIVLTSCEKNRKYPQ